MSISARPCRTALLASAFLAFSVIPASGSELRFVETVGGCHASSAVAATQTIVVSPDQAHVYVHCQELFLPSTSSVAAYDRDPGDGRLTLIETEFLGAAGGSMVISPDGAHLYVATSSHLFAFARDPVSGELEPLDDAVEAPGVVTNESLVITLDGGRLYAIGFSSIWGYERDAATGVIAPGTSTDREGGVASADLSPDGANLYVGNESGSISVYAVDPATGELESIQVVQEGESGVEGFTWAINIAVSGDGKNVYAAGLTDDVAAFARDPATGELQFLHAEPGAGLSTDVGALVVTPDGARVYVSGWGSGSSLDGLSIFARDRQTGRLSYLETARDSLETGELRSPSDIALTSDSRDVYVGTIGQSASVFTALPHCGPSPRVGCSDASSRKSRLQLRNGGENGRKHKLLWTWSGDAGGESVASADDQVFCLHDQTAEGWQARMEATLDAGIDALDARASARSTRITLRGRGAEVPMAELPFAQDSAVSAQLLSRDGQCFGALYSAPAADSSRSFRDRSD